MGEESILIVGDKRIHAEFASDLAGEGWRLSQAADIVEAIELLRKSPHDLVVVDLESLGAPVSHAIQALKNKVPDASILLVAAPGMELDDLAVSPVRPEGLVVKPLERQNLSMAVESALVRRKLLQENRNLKRQLGQALSLSDWVGFTPESQEVRKAIATAALSTGPVLILGEEGTGRRLAAELVHRHGRNPSSALLPIEIPSLPKGELRRLLDDLCSETAPARFPTLSPAALRSGAIYFSELTALSPADQHTLKNLITEPVPFRIIASAAPSVRDAVKRGEFDEELFGLAGSVSISIPPLREVRGDIPVLVDHFLKRSCERSNLKALAVPPKAIEDYMAYDWPGNVAELAMVIERAVSSASAARFDGTALPEQFWSPPSLGVPESVKLHDGSLRDYIASIEKRIIIQTLKRVDGSQKRAAEELRLNPTTLHEKMKRHKILP